jgi:hypothetical protein
VCGGPWYQAVAVTERGLGTTAYSSPLLTALLIVFVLMAVTASGAGFIIAWRRQAASEGPHTVCTGLCFHTDPYVTPTPK